MTVSFDAYVGVSKIAKKLSVLSSEEYALLDYERNIYFIIQKGLPVSKILTARSMKFMKTMLIGELTGRMKCWGAPLPAKTTV